MDCVLQAVQDPPNGEPGVLFTVLLDYRAQPVCPEVWGEGLGKEAPAGWETLRLELPCCGGRAKRMRAPQRSVPILGRTSEGYRGGCPEQKRALKIIGWGQEVGAHL